METGTLIQGRYEILDMLLKCRFSTLYKCMDRSSDMPYVIRVLEESLAGAGDRIRDARIQLQREGRRLMGLKHRHLPRALTVIEEDGTLLLLMEDFHGQTLENLMDTAKGPLSERLLQKIFTQLVSVISFLHSQTPPVIHRDLTPSNVIISPHNVIKLAEFGLARMQEDETGKTLFKSFGDPVFASPQQLQLSPSEPGDDIYSIGAIMYYLATGKKPEKSLKRFQSEIPDTPVRSFNQEITEDFARVIGRMMDPDTHIRFRNLEDLSMEMLKFLPGDTASIILPSFLKMEKSPPKEEAQKEEAPQQAPLDQKEERKPSLWDEIWGEKKKEGGLSPVKGPSKEDLDKFPFIDLSTMQLSREIGQIIPEGVAKSIQGVCIGKIGSREITVAVKDPTQVYVYDHISFATGGRFKATLVRADNLLIDLAQQFIHRTPPSTQGFTWLEWLERKKFEADRLDVKQAVDDVDILGLGEVRGPVIEAVDKIIKEAISIGASDIHLESFETEAVVRYRIDGVLHIMETFEPRLASALVKRIKITAGMDIAQSRICQGGRISVKVKDREFDLRVSIVPVPAGENVVMRLLNKGAFDFSLSDLGFNSEQETLYKKLLSEPHGMMLVSGPTGSGKSTTLYASLKEINRPDRKILTVEDPIEYQMPGISQVQVNLAPAEADKRVTFARALREFLRQDPDVILVGEIRDSETAAIAVQAALTGHLLLSTIHTNDAPGIVTRLVDMGVENFLVSSTLNGGIAQRLVRRICGNCREEAPMPDGLKRELEAEGLTGTTLASGKGCLKCRHTGYKGRVALYEILFMTPHLREMIVKGATSEEIAKAARGEGMRTLYQDGLAKVARGLITMEEVMRVTMGD